MPIGYLGPKASSKRRTSEEFNPPPRLTLLTNSEGPATKVYSFDSELRIISAAQIWSGHVERWEVASLREFYRLLSKLKPNQALCYGITNRAEAPLGIAKSDEVLRGEAIARDRNHMFWSPGPGIGFFDYDPGGEALDCRVVDSFYAAVIPGWGKTERVWVPSSSNGRICGPDGRELRGAGGGWHCYIMLDDMRAMPDLMAMLFQGLWASRHGYIKIGKAGQTLIRTLVDDSTAQPERIDFAAAPVLKDGLTRKAAKPVWLEGAPMLVTEGLKPDLPMDEWRKTNPAVREALERAKSSADQANQVFVNERVAEDVSTGKNPIHARQRWRAATRGGTLPGDFLLRLSDGTIVSVAEVLGDSDHYHETRCYDPIEPSDDGRIAIIYARDGNLFSHRYQTNYRLDSRIATVLHKVGELHRTTDELIEALSRHPDIFQRGGQGEIAPDLVRRYGSIVVPYTPITLQDELRRLVAYHRVKKGELAPCDIPLPLCHTILGKHRRSGMRELDAVITAPTLRLDGSILNVPGYDEKSELYYAPDTDYPAIPDAPCDDEVKAAIDLIREPISCYKFDNHDDLAAYYAAVLTAVIRRTLINAPGFLCDAARGRTGKTKLAKTIATYAAAEVALEGYTRDEEETRKNLLAALRSAKPVIFVDNITGTMRSAAWEAVFTSPGGIWTGRVLGESRQIAVKANAFCLFTGNNATLADNLCERILSIKIVTDGETPHLAEFPFDPVERAAATRPQLISASLTLLRAFIVAGKPTHTSNKLGSFEHWDALVRQCVLWLGIGDPIANIQRMRDHDPDADKLARFVVAIWRWRGNDCWTVSELIKLSPYRNELDDILGSIATNCRNKSNAIGNWLRGHRDVQESGLKIVSAGKDRTKSSVWRIEGKPNYDLQRDFASSVDDIASLAQKEFAKDEDFKDECTEK